MIDLTELDAEEEALKAKLAEIALKREGLTAARNQEIAAERIRQSAARVSRIAALKLELHDLEITELESYAMALHDSADGRELTQYLRLAQDYATQMGHEDKGRSFNTSPAPGHGSFEVIFANPLFVEKYFPAYDIDVGLGISSDIILDDEIPSAFIPSLAVRSILRKLGVTVQYTARAREENDRGRWIGNVWVTIQYGLVEGRSRESSRVD